MNAAKELVKKYKSITLEQVKAEYERLQDKYPDSRIYGSWILENFTGFGSMDTCSLCQEAKELANSSTYGSYCHKCVHSVFSQNDGGFPCVEKTYENICDATTPEAIYTAIQERAEYLKETIDLWKVRTN